MTLIQQFVHIRCLTVLQSNNCLPIVPTPPPSPSPMVIFTIVTPCSQICNTSEYYLGSYTKLISHATPQMSHFVWLLQCCGKTKYKCKIQTTLKQHFKTVEHIKASMKVNMAACFLHDTPSLSFRKFARPLLCGMHSILHLHIPGCHVLSIYEAVYLIGAQLVSVITS